MVPEVNTVFQSLSGKKFIFSNEKILQVKLDHILKPEGFKREYKLSTGIIDFFKDGCGVEVKIKGNKVAIYKQIEKYCSDPEIKAVILVTTRSLGFPDEINGKSCFVLNLNKAWL